MRIKKGTVGWAVKAEPAVPFLYYRKVLAEIKLCKLMILPKEGIENRR